MANGCFRGCLSFFGSDFRKQISSLLQIANSLKLFSKMDLSNLRPAKGSVKKMKRIGRGQGSGHGGTSTKGHKGDKSRSGYKAKRGFEGGQTPMHRRLPKRGFVSPNRVEYVALNLGRIEKIAQKHGISDFTFENLIAAGIVRPTDLVKVLAGGQLVSKVTITLHKASEAAKAAIEAAGGSFNEISKGY